MKFLEKWEAFWMAVTFAQANKSNTARQIIKPRRGTLPQNRPRPKLMSA